MKQNLYSIKDILNGFAPPIIMPNHKSAVRWFEDMSNENPTIGNNKEDFSIHYIGYIETETGKITPATQKFLNHDLRGLGVLENESTEE